MDQSFQFSSSFRSVGTRMRGYRITIIPRPTPRLYFLLDRNAYQSNGTVLELMRVPSQGTDPKVRFNYSRLVPADANPHTTCGLGECPLTGSEAVPVAAVGLGSGSGGPHANALKPVVPAEVPEASRLHNQQRHTLRGAGITLHLGSGGFRLNCGDGGDPLAENPGLGITRHSGNGTQGKCKLLQGKDSF